MRRPSGILLAGAILVLPLLSRPAYAPDAAATAGATGTTGTQQSTQAATPPPLNFTGDVVLWAFTVNPDKTADYDQVIAKLKAALQKIERPEAKQQLAGWKVMKNAMAQPDGTLLYVHIIDPVVKGADYSITNLVYEAFTDPAERTAFYETYRGAIKSAFFQIQGPLVADLSK
jgi:hypothetical protein